MIYTIIFLLKVLENMISTLRIIFISNDHKILASILLFISSIIWILSSSITIININLISILVFSFGSFIGAYLGIFLEEKIALGTYLIISITEVNLVDYLRFKGYIITSLKGNGINGNKYIFNPDKQIDVIKNDIEQIILLKDDHIPINSTSFGLINKLKSLKYIFIKKSIDLDKPTTIKLNKLKLLYCSNCKKIKLSNIKCK